MDVLSTPRRPHKSPAHTVKDRILAKRFRFRVPNISSERAAYYTTIFETVNTFLKIFFEKFCRDSDPSISPAAAAIEGGRILHPISDSSTLSRQLFLLRDADAPEGRLPFVFRRDSRSTKGRESYIRFSIRQYPRSDFFASRYRRPERPPFAVPRRFGQHVEGPRILQPIFDPSSPSRKNIRYAYAGANEAFTRRPGAPARTNACRPAADARRPAAARAPCLRLRRHRCAQRAR